MRLGEILSLMVTLPNEQPLTLATRYTRLLFMRYRIMTSAPSRAKVRATACPIRCPLRYSTTTQTGEIPRDRNRTHRLRFY